MKLVNHYDLLRIFLESSHHNSNVHIHGVVQG